MPIYEYECTSCCTVFEVIQRMTEDPLSTCPDCSGPVNKLMSMSSFQLKGGGWYADGYSSASCNGSGPAKADTDSATKTSPEKAEKATGSSAEKVVKATSSTSESSAAVKSKESCSATT